MKWLLGLILMTQVGCAELISYAVVSAATVTGHIAHDLYKEEISGEEGIDDQE